MLRPRIWRKVQGTGHKASDPPGESGFRNSKSLPSVFCLLPPASCLSLCSMPHALCPMPSAFSLCAMRYALCGSQSTIRNPQSAIRNSKFEIISLYLSPKAITRLHSSKLVGFMRQMAHLRQSSLSILTTKHRAIY